MDIEEGGLDVGADIEEGGRKRIGMAEPTPSGPGTQILANCRLELAGVEVGCQGEEGGGGV